METVTVEINDVLNLLFEDYHLPSLLILSRHIECAKLIKLIIVYVEQILCSSRVSKFERKNET